MRLQALSLLAALALAAESVGAFTFQTASRRTKNAFALASTAPSDDAAFSSFADSLEEDSAASKPSAKAKASSTKFSGKSSYSNNVKPAMTASTWKSDLDEILNPTTAQARRQILVSQLLTANAEIRVAVEDALRDRKVCHVTI
jgi:hypothetical protein